MTGQISLAECDEPGTTACRLLDELDGLVDGRLRIEEDWRGLDRSDADRRLIRHRAHRASYTISARWYTKRAGADREDRAAAAALRGRILLRAPVRHGGPARRPGVRQRMGPGSARVPRPGLRATPVALRRPVHRARRDRRPDPHHRRDRDAHADPTAGRHRPARRVLGVPGAGSPHPRRGSRRSASGLPAGWPAL